MSTVVASSRRKPLRLGIVGCGWAGEQAVIAGNDVARATVVAIADPDSGRRSGVQQRHDVPRAYVDYQELLRDDEVDAVYLATNPLDRLPMVMATLRSGRPVLIQKPHATKPADIRRIARVAEQTDQLAQFCFYRRHLPREKKLHALLTAGHIGDIYHGRIRVQYNHLPALAEHGSTWLNVYGNMGGALAQHASHEVDLCWWFMGCPRPLWAFAVKHSPFNLYTGPEEPAEDCLSGLVGFEGGATMQVDAVRMGHQRGGMDFHLYGTEGALNKVHISKAKSVGAGTPDGFREREVMASDKRPGADGFFYHEVEDFVKAVAGEMPPNVPASEAYVYLKILEALYRSGLKRTKVQIHLN